MFSLFLPAFVVAYDVLHVAKYIYVLLKITIIYDVKYTTPVGYKYIYSSE